MLTCGISTLPLPSSVMKRLLEILAPSLRHSCPVRRQALEAYLRAAQAKHVCVLKTSKSGWRVRKEAMQLSRCAAEGMASTDWKEAPQGDDHPYLDKIIRQNSLRNTTDILQGCLPGSSNAWLAASICAAQQKIGQSAEAGSPGLTSVLWCSLVDAAMVHTDCNGCSSYTVWGAHRLW